MKLFGITGWSGSGKTTLIERLVPVLRQRGFVVGVLKHAHHNFDIDTEGKDSWRFRQAGCFEVAISSSRRWALMHEHDDGDTEPDVFAMCARFDSKCNLILVEGYKDAPLPKLEVWRRQGGGVPIAANNAHVVAVATDDDELPQFACPLLPLNDIDVVADFIIGQIATND
ncbi:molybdopterin-guanine dinucleotide biosynthesis protein B [Candidatus Persebacteraceae bacterium Df01]|jgi:molybdopterin-guanine dinucleotide biosynthesis protein B|uniref:Molybdopterin-guanine dinucleotide biosynthesis protein B n=1 Tax=Candidatus Doriopsillibacter californiensis TaxID=2970740 RepID=A0ABT7QNI0_9GAMM|nr:molybdopterin-guanine dinucleotide biosynthesis protein B [Candidatus Persebacteraceae bacterium Df01]